MSTPYLGEIRVVGFNFPPEGWVPCNGQPLAINEYDALYALIGTTYGGDGINSFNVPNLNGRVAPGAGTGPGLSTYTLGMQGGLETVTLTTNQLPAHTHAFSSPLGANSNPGNTDNPVGNLPGSLPNGYAGAPTAGANLAAVALSSAMQPAGNSLPHPNMQPSLAMNFIIATTGIYPSKP